MTIDEFLTANSITNSECALHIGTTREMVRRYRYREAMPRADKKIAIMDYSHGMVSATLDWPPLR